MAKRVSIELELKIVEMYNSGIPVRDIIEASGASRAGIQKFVKRQGYPLTRGNLSDLLKQEAIALYNAGVSEARILQSLKISKASLYNILREFEIQYDRGRKYHTLNPDFFSEIDTEEKAYFLGWMVSDGWIGKVNKEYSAIGLGVTEADRCVLDRFQEALLTSSPVGVSNTKTKPIARLVVRSQQLANDLALYGVVPRKSAITFYPELINVPSIHAAFIRGLFDGDGCGSGGYFNLCGTSILLSGVAQALTKFAGVTARNPAAIPSKRFLHYLQYTGKVDVTKIYEFLYGSASCDLCLHRKREKLKIGVDKVNPRVKLNLELAREIRAMHNEEGCTYRVLSRKYGVTVTTIWQIVKNRIWIE